MGNRDANVGIEGGGCGNGHTAHDGDECDRTVDLVEGESHADNQDSDGE